MTWWQGIILGLVQGFTEFLPVSSSGHLALLQGIMGLDGGSLLLFDTLVHLGTLVAVVAVYWQELWQMLKKPWAPLPLLLILATLPAVVAGFLFEDAVTAVLQGGIWLGVGFLVTAIALLAVEHFFPRFTEHTRRKGRELDQLTWKDALLIGLAQAVAIFPGISRSGATLSAGLTTKLSRQAAAKFAFLMSVPVILGSVVLQVLKLDSLSGILNAPVILGFLCAAVSGYLAIRWMLSLLQRSSLRMFAIYVSVLGVWIIVDSLVLHWVF